MSALDVFWAAPPISRTLAAGALSLSVLVYTSILPAYYVVFLPSALVRFPPQLWRILTSFLVTGKDLSILMDTYFLYTYGSKLETASPRFSHPSDFFTYLVFVCVTILSLNVLFTGGFIFTSALVLAFAYTSAQDSPGARASFFVVTIPGQWVPFAMLLMTFVTGGPHAAKVQLTGLVAAHAHDFLTRIWPQFGGGTNLLGTPSFVREMFERRMPRVKTSAAGTAIRPAGKAGASGTGSSKGSVLPEAWQSRGAGHRLGGD